MARHKDLNWDLHEPHLQNGKRVHSWETIHAALLMDIRDELKQLNQTLGCFRLMRMAEDIHRLERRAAKHMPLQGGRPRNPP